MSLNSRIKDVYASLTTSEKIIADFYGTSTKASSLCRKKKAAPRSNSLRGAPLLFLKNAPLRRSTEHPLRPHGRPVR